ncbi:MAG: DUF3878 family protein [Clostridia bacterium]|nr:DUF3878 family protein [Clostridia bacterium]
MISTVLSKIDYNFIELFATAYEVSRNVFDTEPSEASARLQKKIRKWATKTYLEGESFPKLVAEKVAKTVSDADFIAFLKACHDHVEEKGTHQRTLFDQSSADLSEEVRHAVWSLIEEKWSYNRIRTVGANAELEVESSYSYTRTLTLINASCIPEKYDALSFENATLIKQDGEYRLIGEAFLDDKESEDNTAFPFALRFTDATVRVELHRADEGAFNPKPWEHLVAIASNIYEKTYLPGDYLNEQEKALLPLLKELKRLSVWEDKDKDLITFPLLRGYFEKYGYHELLPHLDVFSISRCDDKLLEKLNRKKYEPLWRELFELVTASQEGYPAETCSSERWAELRACVQEELEARGYSGQYPDFIKHGAVRGLRLALDAEGRSYFVCGEKNVTFYIHCREFYDEDYKAIDFSCGTALLRKNETAEDIHACRFAAKGRRFYRSFCYEDPAQPETDDMLESMIDVAAKRAELRRLTKQDRQMLSNGNDTVSSLWIFWLTFLVFGGLFTAIFMPLMMIFGFLVLWIGGAPEAFLEIPWWLMILISWIGAGGGMGLVSLFISRK